MEVRRFSIDRRTPVPGDHRGLWGVPIQFDRSNLANQDLDDLARRLNGLPIFLDRPMHVVALYVDSHGAMAEHSAPVPILFLVTGGRGYVRIGGPTGETREVTSGDAVMWPAGIDHTVWTEDDPLSAIIIDGPPERSSS